MRSTSWAGYQELARFPIISIFQRVSQRSRGSLIFEGFLHCCTYSLRDVGAAQSENAQSTVTWSSNCSWSLSNFRKIFKANGCQMTGWCWRFPKNRQIVLAAHLLFSFCTRRHVEQIFDADTTQRSHSGVLWGLQRYYGSSDPFDRIGILLNSWSESDLQELGIPKNV